MQNRITCTHENVQAALCSLNKCMHTYSLIQKQHTKINCEIYENEHTLLFDN